MKEISAAYVHVDKPWLSSMLLAVHMHVHRIRTREFKEKVRLAMQPYFVWKKLRYCTRSEAEAETYVRECADAADLWDYVSWREYGENVLEFVAKMETALKQETSATLLVSAEALAYIVEWAK